MLYLGMWSSKDKKNKNLFFLVQYDYILIVLIIIQNIIFCKL